MGGKERGGGSESVRLRDGEGRVGGDRQIMIGDVSEVQEIHYYVDDMIGRKTEQILRGKTS